MINTSQRRLVPSSSMLLAFDAAARMGSFTEAAAELDLTQGAISRQINALEKQLDVALFERIKKTVHLTQAGKIYAKEIHSALQIIRNASLNAMSNPMSGTLNLAILPTLGTRWLMPRLPDFLQQHPDITVNFVTKLKPFDFRQENLHAALHFGLPNWPDTTQTYLMGEAVIPVCSPTFLQQNPIDNIQDLAKLPLLHLSTRPKAWDDWFKHSKIDEPKRLGMLFEEISIIAKAAASGLGVALLPKFLIQSELDRGELVLILDLPVKSGSGYYLVTPLNRAEYAPVVALTQWLLTQVKTDIN